MNTSASNQNIEPLKKLVQQAPKTAQSRTWDPLSSYIASTKQYALLSRAQEQALALRVQESGDTAAARELVEANLRLVVKIAHPYKRAHQNLLDLVQEGNIGLMHAVAKFDPSLGNKLSSYAAPWIRACILKFILNNHRLVRLGTTQAQRKLFFNLSKSHDRLKRQGFEVDAGAIAKALNVREQDVVEMQKRLGAPDASFDAPLSTGDDGGVRTRHDVMEDEQSDRPDIAVERSEFNVLLKLKLEAFADGLESRDEQIFRQRWLCDKPVKLKAIGTAFGVSRERARQLEKRILGRVRDYLLQEMGSAIGIEDQLAAEAA